MFQGTLIYGFVNSVTLALIALGFNLTFGISGVANFAYGALYILAAYTAWILLTWLKINYFLSIVLAVLFTSFIGGLIYRFILLRVRGMPISEVIASFGIGLAILEFFRFLGFVGSEYTLPVFIDGSVSLGGTYIDVQRLLIVGIGVVLVIFLWLFTHYTKTGLAFRGMAQEERTALILGINSDKMATFSLAFGSGLAGVAAITILPLGQIAVEGGYSALINALAVCIVGGLGSTGGVLVAAVLIGFAQSFTATYIGSHWMMIVSLVAILVILILKPSGLFGKQKELEERI
ncbi:MAG: branched-chain amino acid ABC transporter permease [Deltaproteobacteria bacterium]|nr:branched-chain amino acid ABC transporter permease [Deltaproteobacteria bacterium]